MNYKCTAVNKIKDISNEYSLLKIEFDGGLLSSYMIANYTQTLDFINKDVEVTFRQDLFEGKLEQFVNNIVVIATVNTLDKTDNFKLFSDKKDSLSNVCFADLQPGQVVNNAILYCTEHIYEDSAKAYWANLTVLDSCYRVRHLRLFSPKNREANFSGSYIKCDIRVTPYGLTTEDIYPQDQMPHVNPEVTIAKEYVLRVVADDEKLQEYINSLHLLDILEQTVYKEKGYALVCLARELYVMFELSNLTNTFNLVDLKRAIVASYGHYAYPSFECSNTVTSALALIKSPLRQEANLYRILDAEKNKETPERKIYLQIKEFVKTLTSIVKEEEVK